MPDARRPLRNQERKATGREGWGEEISISPNPAPNPICPDGVIPPCHPTPNPHLVLGALHLTLSPHPSSV